MHEEIFSDLRKRMEGAITSAKHSLNGLRTGRASTALLDPIRVDAYGSPMPLSQLGTVNAPESQLLTVQVWDAGLVSPVATAITDSGLGLNPIVEGQSIRIPLPKLSEERRKELSKKATEYGENAKISIRNIRRDGMDAFKKLEKEKSISEDEMHTHSDKVQKITDEFITKVESEVSDKQKEILSV